MCSSRWRTPTWSSSAQAASTPFTRDLDHAAGVQRLEVSVREAGLAEHVAGVLPQAWSSMRLLQGVRDRVDGRARHLAAQQLEPLGGGLLASQVLQQRGQPVTIAQAVS